MPFSARRIARLKQSRAIMGGRLARAGLALAAVLLLLAAVPHPAAAENMAPRPGDRALGSGDAPIVMIAYYSLDCSHCAKFHLEVFPPLRSQFMETGKVRFVFRDFPLSWAALQAAILTHCAPPERYFAVQKALFEAIGAWSKAPSTHDAVAKIGAAVGIPEAAFETCMQEREWEHQVFESQKYARDVLGVSATRTFFINGEKLVGTPTFEKLSQGLYDMLIEIAQEARM